MRCIFEYLFKKEQLWLLPLAGIVVLYLLPGLYGVVYFQTPLSIKLLFIFLIGSISYLVFYQIFIKYFDSDLFKIPRFSLGILRTSSFIAFTFAVYFICFFYAVYSAEKLPLYEAIVGSDPHVISASREAFLKGRAGWEKVFIYINVLLTSACVPYAIALSYVGKLRYRHILLFVFVLSLIISMEKFVVMKALLPVIVLSFNGYLLRKYGYLLIAIAAIIVITMTKLSGAGALQTSSAVGVYQAEMELLDGKIKGSDAERKILYRYAVVDTSTPILYVLNRALWIPYVTSYDWIFHFYRNLHGIFLHGKTNSTIAFLTNQERYNMERSVFKFQFGGGDTGTSNTVFLIDAFVNFGWSGVIISSFFVALFTRFFTVIKNPAAYATFYFYIIHFLTSSLFSIMFGGGLILLIFLAFTHNGFED